VVPQSFAGLLASKNLTKYGVAIDNSVFDKDSFSGDEANKTNHWTTHPEV